MCCMRLVENTGRKNGQNSPYAHHRTSFVRLCFRNEGTYRQSEKYLLNSNIHMSSQYGELRPTNRWDRLGNVRHSSKFQRFLANVKAICYRPSVCRLSVVCLSVTFVRPTQAVQIFGNISTALSTLAIHGHSLKILRRSSQGNPSAGGVKDKRGSKI